MELAIVLLIIVATIHAINSVKILGVFHMPAYSHFQLGDKLLKELAARGHEVTIVTPYKEKESTENFKTIELNGIIEEVEKVKVDLFSQTTHWPIINLLWLDMMGSEFAENALKHPQVEKLLKSNEKFDLIIFEQFVNEAFYGFAHRFQAPVVVLSTIGGSRWTNPKMGNPGSPSYVPDIYLSSSPYMNFWKRLYNSMFYLTGELFTHFYTYRRQNEILQKYFPGAPHLSDLIYNTSLILLNSHVSTNPPVPYVPNMIEIGGYHINPPKPLPQDLKSFLDNAKEGVIYFSMGSNLKSKNLPKEKRDEILRAFSKLKQKVLWKWEDDSLPGQPSNVKLAKWLPQQDILAHPNVKLFITHGGLLSTIETVYHGVPIIGIPVFGDQDMNIANAVISGYGIGVPYNELTEERLSKALNEILTNPKYSENVKRRSKIMHDQPIKPLNQAMFWIEYVLRHNGASHLRSAALNLNWYQYLLLDVTAFIILTILVGLFVLRIILKKLCCKTSKVKANKTKKNN